MKIAPDRARAVLMTEEVAAELLGIKKSTLANERRFGRVGYVRLTPRSIRYTNVHLEEWVKLREVAATRTGHETSQRLPNPYLAARAEEKRRDGFRKALELLNQPTKQPEK